MRHVKEEQHVKKEETKEEKTWEKRSSYCYPSRKYAEEYTKSVENIRDENLRKLIKVILCCGWRFGEVLNSYIFRDAEGNVIIRGINLKTKKFKIIEKQGDVSYFLGARRLKLMKRLQIWKSVPMQNIFNIDTTELETLINDNDDDNIFFIAEKLGIYNYRDAYRRLQRSANEIKIKYKRNVDETDVVMFYKPAFHFYRKLFAAQYNLINDYNLLKTIDFMRWKNLNVITKYVKDY